MEAAFICSEKLWSQGFGETHPLKPERLERTYELLTAYRAFDAHTAHLVPPRPATREELPLFHTAKYVGAVASPSDAPSLPALSRAEGSKGDVLSSSKGRGERRARASR